MDAGVWEELFIVQQDGKEQYESSNFNGSAY